MKLIHYSLLSSLLLLLGSCTKDLMFFDENNYISSSLTLDNDVYKKSFTFAFLQEDQQDTILSLPFKFAGRLSNTDRSFQLKVVDSLSTMTEGIDYSWGELGPKGVVLANAKVGHLALKLLKTPKLKEKIIQLHLEIVTNEYFQPGQEQLVRITSTDQLIKPDWWAYAHTRYLGAFSTSKLQYWLEFMNVLDGTDPWFYAPYSAIKWNAWSFIDPAIIASAVSFRSWLINQKGDPMDPDLEMPISQSLGQ